MAGLSALISKISNSEEVDDHIQIMCECLERKHLRKPKPKQFLSTAHLKQFSNYLTPISKFSQPLAKHSEHYEAVKEIVKKTVGSYNPEDVSRFLRSQFTCLRDRKASWLSIFNNADHLTERSSRSFSFEMKKLVEKFTSGKAVEFFHKM